MTTSQALTTLCDSLMEMIMMIHRYLYTKYIWYLVLLPLIFSSSCSQTYYKQMNSIPPEDKPSDMVKIITKEGKIYHSGNVVFLEDSLTINSSEENEVMINLGYPSALPLTLSYDEIQAIEEQERGDLAFLGWGTIIVVLFLLIHTAMSFDPGLGT